jgi:hypothetical protein
MAMSPTFVAFGRAVLARGTGEIGMHLHAWSSPPILPLTRDDCVTHPYLIEYPDEVMEAKIKFLTELLEETFGRKMLSHRAGRWAFDSRYAKLLVKYGYLVDCSVTPHISWRTTLGDPAGHGGTDYESFPEGDYFVDLDDLRSAGGSALLEVPLTIMQSSLAKAMPWLYSSPTMGRLRGRLPRRVTWLRPDGTNLTALLSCVQRAVAEGRSYIEFMLHSSELMPGGSPTFRNDSSIERLYADLRTLFREIAGSFTGATLHEHYLARVVTRADRVRVLHD